MSLRIIESMPHWNQAKKYLIENAYSAWQWQYRWNHEEGFHAWFGNSETVSENDRIEIITHCEDVEKAIVKFNSQNEHKK